MLIKLRKYTMLLKNETNGVRKLIRCKLMKRMKHKLKRKLTRHKFIKYNPKHNSKYIYENVKIVCYFYLIYVKTDKLGEQRIKIGITTRPIKFRINEHTTSCIWYNGVLIAKFFMTRKELFDMETECLNATIEYAVDLINHPLNECRERIEALKLWEICKTKMPEHTEPDYETEKEKDFPAPSKRADKKCFEKYICERKKRLFKTIRQKYGPVGPENLVETKQSENLVETKEPETENSEISEEFYDGDIQNDILHEIENEKVTENVMENKNDVENKITNENNTQSKSCIGGPNIKTPFEYQTEIINESLDFFKNNNKGILNLPCGSGKTLISLWIAEHLAAKTIVIGVPSIALSKQWLKNIMVQYPKRIVFPIMGGVTIENITNFLKKNPTDHIIVLCYASSHKFLTCFKKQKATFDLVIFDECHHLTCQNFVKASEKKSYVKILNIATKKTLSLTATLKEFQDVPNVSDEKTGDIEQKTGDLEQIFEIQISNASKEIFGPVILRRSLLWVIEQKVVCDYSLQVVFIENFAEVLKFFTKMKIETALDQRFFLTAFVTLKNIVEKHSHHILIYANTIENSERIMFYIERLITEKYFDLPEIARKNYHSRLSQIEKDIFLKEFETSPVGIMGLVYSLAEGFDMPIIDAVVFSEKMDSNIRITQSALRCIRKCIADPTKKAKIILPAMLATHVEGDMDPENLKISADDLEKIKRIVIQMGVEDISIGQKIKVGRFVESIDGSNLKKTAYVKNQDKVELKNQENFGMLGQFDPELSRQIALKIIPRINLSYGKTKKIVIGKKISTREQYSEECAKDPHLPIDPEKTFQQQFKGWVDYLGLRENFADAYYTLDECKKRIAELFMEHPEIKKNDLDYMKIAENLSRLDPNFPQVDFWQDFYVVNLCEICRLPLKKSCKTNLKQIG